WLLSWGQRRRKLALGGFAVLLVACVMRFLFYGSEFIPNLNEGAIYVRATLPNSVNLDESVALAQDMRQQLRTFDEVEFVMSQAGRPNDGTDPTGFFNIEFHIQLHPESDWTRRISKDQLLGEMREKLETYPGINFGFSQPIQDNVEEYVAGVKSALVVKIFGEDLYQLEDHAGQVERVLATVPGITDLTVYKNIGLPELRIQLHDSKMARYAVNTADVQAVVAMAI